MILVLMGVLFCFVTVENILEQSDIYIAKTTSGERCTIPFVYKGKVHHDCITDDASKAWCYVDKHFQNWDYCKPHPKEYVGCEIRSPNITAEEVEEILYEHNNFRSKMPALRMRKLEWNSELAQKAQLAAEKCKHVHVESNLCGNRLDTGQNLFYSYNDDFYPDLRTWKNVIKAWSGEEKFYDITTNTCQPGELCGHFQAVAWNRTNFIGCGKSYCHGHLSGKTRHSIQYFCNYFPAGIIPTQRPFAVSKGEKCKNCHLFDQDDRFRCDKDNLCETCDTKMEGCIGIEDIKKMAAANSSLCIDTVINCEENVGLCALSNTGMDLPQEILDLLKNCRKTCGTCP